MPQSLQKSKSGASIWTSYISEPSLQREIWPRQIHYGENKSQVFAELTAVTVKGVYSFVSLEALLWKPWSKTPTCVFYIHMWQRGNSRKFRPNTRTVRSVQVSVYRRNDHFVAFVILLNFLENSPGLKNYRSVSGLFGNAVFSHNPFNKYHLLYTHFVASTCQAVLQCVFPIEIKLWEHCSPL